MEQDKTKYPKDESFSIGTVLNHTSGAYLGRSRIPKKKS